MGHWCSTTQSLGNVLYFTRIVRKNRKTDVTVSFFDDLHCKLLTIKESAFSFTKHHEYVFFSIVQNYVSRHSNLMITQSYQCHHWTCFDIFIECCKKWVKIDIAAAFWEIYFTILQFLPSVCSSLRIVSQEHYSLVCRHYISLVLLTLVLK